MDSRDISDADLTKALQVYSCSLDLMAELDKEELAIEEMDREEEK
jgi:hypothetical protein